MCWAPVGHETVSTPSFWHLWPQACLLPTAPTLGHLGSSALCREGAQTVSTVDVNPSAVTRQLCSFERVLYPLWFSVHPLSLLLSIEHLLCAAYTIAGGGETDNGRDPCN